MEITRRGLALICLIAFLVGLEPFYNWIKILEVRNSPIVLGRILERNACRNYGVPSVDFTIEVQGQNVRVHAITGRYLISKVPDTVHFHYSGNPELRVFLFEYDQNPLWIWLFCWAVGLQCFVIFLHKSKNVKGS